MQALHLLSLIDAYFSRTFKQEETFDYNRLVSGLKAAGKMKEQYDSLDDETKWDTWIERETRRRQVKSSFGIVNLANIYSKNGLLNLSVRCNSHRIFLQAAEDIALRN